MSPSEETPGMVELNPSQLREVTLLVFGTESVADDGCPEDGSRPNGTRNELVALAGDGGEDGRVENGREVG